MHKWRTTYLVMGIVNIFIIVSDYLKQKKTEKKPYKKNQI